LRSLKQYCCGGLKDLLEPPPSQNSFLDGLRSIAILLVVNSHFAADFSAIHGDNAYSLLQFVMNGWVGVDLFFVLSGFFIGGQLWKELQRTDTISIKRFVLRRGLRIWPLYFFTFATIFILYWPAAADKGFGWADLVFLVNYFNAGIVLGGWSLSTEEQFYVLAPILIYLSARGRKLSAIRPWLWCVFALLPLLRAVIWMGRSGHLFRHDPVLFAKLYYPFHTHCDGLVMGLIVANLWVSQDRVGTRRPSAILLVAASALAMLLLRRVHHEIFVFTGLAMFFGCLVWFGLTWKSTLFGAKVFYWISRLSFGIYLNHPYLIRPIVNGICPHIQRSRLGTMGAQLAGVVVLVMSSAAISLLTFCFIEHPFLELRAKLLKRSASVSRCAHAR
jgi:peptidoglycan/LPS O-acetylase OafA/YrhL